MTRSIALASWAALRGIVAAAALFAAALPATANEYSVSPMRLDLDHTAQSAVVTLHNFGTEPMDFQVQAREWTQDAGGKDVYGETGDLVFFPKIFTVLPNEDRVVRIGVKSLPAITERTFRLFIERIPAPVKEPPRPGAQVAINVRFALPVFVRPPTATDAQGAIESATLDRGTLSVVLRNTGNVHFRMDDGVALTGRDARGNAVWSGKLDDRYLLAGATKRLSTAIPLAACTKLAALELAAVAERLTLSRTLAVSRENCE